MLGDAESKGKYSTMSRHERCATEREKKESREQTKEEIDESVGSMQLNYCMLGVMCQTDVLPLLKSLGFTWCVCVRACGASLTA